MKNANRDDLLKLKQELIQEQQKIAATVLDTVEEEVIVVAEKNETDVILEKVAKKSKLTIDEQIKYLKIKGVTFNYMDEDKAKTYLAEHSYYYKLTSYRKNFIKNKDSQYSNVDFATLVDLAVVDMHLRYLLIRLSLDIEHALKTLLINLITESDEDGYAIVEEYNQYEHNNFIQKIDNGTHSDTKKAELKKSYKPVQQKILTEYKSERDYSHDLWTKRKDNPSIWVLIEMMSYGQLASFIKFYYDKSKFGSKQLQMAYHYLYFSKNVRDSSAHSRPIILNVIEDAQFKSGKSPKPQLKSYLLKASVPKNIANRYLTNLKVHDLCALLLLHNKYIKGSIARRERKKEIRYILKRARYRKHLYHNIPELGEILLIFNKIIKSY